MGILDAYQDSTDTALRMMATQPLTPEPVTPKHSTWSAPFRAVAAGAAEVAGNVMDTAGAFGQVAAASGGLTPGFDPDTKKNRNATVEAFDKLKTEGINWRTDEAQQAYKFGSDLRPDPLTAGTAENLVFSLTKGLTKAITAAVALGPVGGAAAFGVSEGLTTAEDLANQGVDQQTRSKVGAVTGAMSAAGVVLPVAGKTLAQTAGLVLVGGPASFMAQQQATRSILENANYGEIAKQYDPLDPVGLTIATLLPAGFAAYAKRGGFKATTKPDAQPAADNATATQGTVIPATPEAIDAAMVQNLTVARDARESSVAENNISESLGRLSELSLQQAGEVGITGNMTEGRIPPADWKILEEAGLIENRVSEDGTEYRAANMEALFNERARRHAENMANKSSVSPEEKARNIERRASNYERAAQSKEDEGYPEDAIPLREKAEQLRKQAESVRSEKSAESATPAAPTVKDSLSVQPEQAVVRENRTTETPDAYRARVDALAKEQPDLIARLDDAGQPVKLADELTAIKKQAQEGTDTDFGALDAPLLKTAIECALSLGAA